MKSKGLIITLIVILSLLGISLVGGMILLMNKKYDFSFNFNIADENLKLRDTYEATGEVVEKINTDLTNADIEVKETSEETIKVEYYSNKKKDLIMKQENTTLIIEDKEKKDVCVGICSEKRKVVLYIPESYIGEYNLNTISGDVTFEKDTANNNVTIDTKSGDISLGNAKVVNITTISGDVNTKESEKTKVRTTSGDIKVTKATESSDIKTVSGDVKLVNGNRVIIKTTSGDISISKASKSVEVETISGDITINTLSIDENSNIKTTSGDVSISNNTNNCYVDTTTTSGDINVNKSDRKSDLTLAIKTTSGDITVR